MNLQKTLAATASMAAIALVLGANTATAAPVTLLCHSTSPAMVEDGPTTIILDEAQGTAAVQFAGYGLSGGTGHLNGYSVGPMRAAFSPQQVTFENPDPNSAPGGGHDKYTLNRLTGDMTGLQGPDTMNCSVATNRF
jgi:hypothetical protein